jgi:hypothetical protein
MTTKSISGQCQCGNVTWTSTAPPAHLDYCYCSTCQQVSGAPFMAWMGIPKSDLIWSFKKEPFVYRSNIGETGVSVSERHCCGNDGCNISLQYYLYPEKTHVAASTITRNDFDVPKVGCHIWTKSVPKWHTISEDGVPRYEEFDAEFTKLLEDYLKERKQ